MKTYTTAELKDILNKHALWLRGDPSGVRANLSEADLYGADLRGASLSDAIQNIRSRLRRNLVRKCMA